MSRYLPVGITRNQGLALIEALNTGKHMSVEVSRSYFYAEPSRNVIAELNNDIKGDQVLIIGAHFRHYAGFIRS